MNAFLIDFLIEVVQHGMQMFCLLLYALDLYSDLICMLCRLLQLYFQDSTIFLFLFHSRCVLFTFVCRLPIGFSQRVYHKEREPEYALLHMIQMHVFNYKHFYYLDVM